jgi:hypothetical protein
MSLRYCQTVRLLELKAFIGCKQVLANFLNAFNSLIFIRVEVILLKNLTKNSFKK